MSSIYCCNKIEISKMFLGTYETLNWERMCVLGHTNTRAHWNSQNKLPMFIYLYFKELEWHPDSLYFPSVAKTLFVNKWREYMRRTY